MKKLFFTLTLAAFALAAMAQEPAKKPSWSGFVSNGFWDNWEITVGAGVGTAMTTGNNCGSFGDRLGFEGNFAITKWLHPVAGLRLQLQGGRFVNFDSEMGKVKWPYIGVHTDLMVNLSNWIGGYREDRAYYAVPFVGFGYFASSFTDSFHNNYGGPTHQDFGFVYGLQNKFRISPSFDFNIELKGLLTHGGFAPIDASGQYMTGFSATAGFTYRFKQRGWERGVPGFTADDIQAFQDAVAMSNAALAESMAANAALAEDLAAAEEAARKAQADAAAARAQIKPVYYDMGMPVIFFTIGTSTLDSRNQVRLDLVADQAKRAPKDVVFSIQGHADPQTGTPAINERLSVARAKAVYDYLISKGVAADRMTYEGMGTKDNPFKLPITNRVAVITFK